MSKSNPIKSMKKIKAWAITTRRGTKIINNYDLSLNYMVFSTRKRAVKRLEYELPSPFGGQIVPVIISFPAHKKSKPKA